jgi:hypothetical protein
MREGLSLVIDNGCGGHLQQFKRGATRPGVRRPSHPTPVGFGAAALRDTAAVDDVPTAGDLTDSRAELVVTRSRWGAADRQGRRDRRDAGRLEACGQADAAAGDAGEDAHGGRLGGRVAERDLEAHTGTTVPGPLSLVVVVIGPGTGTGPGTCRVRCRFV